MNVQQHRGHFDLNDKTRFDLEDSIAVWTKKLKQHKYKYNGDLKKLRHECTNYDQVVKDIERGAFPYLNPNQHEAAVDCAWAAANQRVTEAQRDLYLQQVKETNDQLDNVQDNAKKSHERLAKRDLEYAALYREYEKVKMQRDSYARSNGQLVRRNKEWKQKTEKRNRAIARLQKKLDDLTN